MSFCRIDLWEKEIGMPLYTKLQSLIKDFIKDNPGRKVILAIEFAESSVETIERWAKGTLLPRPYTAQHVIWYIEKGLQAK